MRKAAATAGLRVRFAVAPAPSYLPPLRRGKQKERLMSSKRPSRREAQRFAAQVVAAQTTIPDLTTELQARLDAYSLSGPDRADWTPEVRSAHHEVMRRSQLVGEASFIKHLGVVAKFLAFRSRNHLSLDISEAFSAAAIDHYYLHGVKGTDATRNDYRSRLINIAVKINPGVGAPVKTPTLGHRAVRPGYSVAEEAAIRRTAMRQRNPKTLRALCAIVGLCAGAGLDPTDLRELRRTDVVDHGPEGIEVTVRVGKPRVVWVRRDYEQLVRIGLENLAKSALVIGEQVGRRNITTHIINRAELHDAPDLDASRLRSTWLVWLMTRQVPVQVILYASGLKTARSLTDLISQLPAVNPADSIDELRGEQS